ncbi:MAG: hypothetical protein ACK5K8_05470, partial [Pseudanabaena sp.]
LQSDFLVIVLGALRARNTITLHDYLNLFVLMYVWRGFCPHHVYSIRKSYFIFTSSQIKFVL